MYSSPRSDNQTKTNVMKEFNYQKDAISSNWPVHHGAYTDYLVYQLEWVTGSNGYVRWMLAGHPIFEVTSDTFQNVSQDKANSNPQKQEDHARGAHVPHLQRGTITLLGAKPANLNSVCRGEGNREKFDRICDEYPMHMKIDNIRLYQDQGEDLEADNYMQVGCDPASYPIKQWINGHTKEFTDDENPTIEVGGGAVCTADDDCTILPEGDLQSIKLITGTCQNNRCACTNGKSWGGPRCTVALDASKSLTTTDDNVGGYGPPFELAAGIASSVVLLTALSVWWAMRKAHHEAKAALRQATLEKPTSYRGSSNDMVDSFGPSQANYTRKFV